MSIHECIKVYNQIDVEQYLQLLQSRYHALPHPTEPKHFLIDYPPLPFRRPSQCETHLSILGFAYMPLSSLLLLALATHPELVPPATTVEWLSEQDRLYVAKL